MLKLTVFTICTLSFSISIVWGQTNKPLSLINHIYAGETPNFSILTNQKLRNKHYSDEISSLYASKIKCLKKTGRDHLDFNFMVAGQDAKISNQSIKEVYVNNDVAIYMVSFLNAKNLQTFFYKIVKKNKLWRISNVFYQGASLKEELKQDCL